MSEVAMHHTAAPAASPVAPLPGSSGAAIAQSGDAHQYLTFFLGGEMYAVGILNVKEIIEYGSLTEIPMMPGFVRGVINLRGAVVPVIDLAARFHGKATAVQKRTCNVIVEVRQDGIKHDVGIMVDAVSEVLEIPPKDIEPPPSFGAKIRADFIAGMGKADGRFVIILDIQCVLSADDLIALAGLGRHGRAPGSEAPSPGQT